MLVCLCGGCSSKGTRDSAVLSAAVASWTLPPGDLQGSAPRTFVRGANNRHSLSVATPGVMGCLHPLQEPPIHAGVKS